MAQSEQEILEGLAEIVNEEDWSGDRLRAARQVLHGGPRHRLAVDDDDRRQREEKFGVRIPDEEVKNLTTVGDAVAFIAKNQG